MLPVFPDATATDQTADFSLNFSQMGKYPWGNPQSPTNSLPSRTPSPASVSCRTISSLETRRSTPLDSEQLQTPIFVLSDLAGSDPATLTTYPKSGLKHLNQEISYIRVNAGSIHSSQEPTASPIDNNELENLRLSTGVPRHMMDVFRANPFTSMDWSRATNTTPPSLDSSTTVNSIDGDSLRAAPMAKRKLSKSPESAEPRRKGRTKRARIQTHSFVPFPATGPQEMYAYEFMVDIDPPRRSRELSYVENNGWSNRPSLSGLVDDNEHLPTAQSGETYYSEDTCMRSPPADCGLSLPSRLSHSYSHNTSFPARSNSSRHMHPSYFPFLPSAPLHAQMSPCFGASSNSLVPASCVDNNESWSRFEEREYGSLPSVVPTQVMTENIHTRPRSTTPLGTSPRSPFYACPLCPRDFKLPNGLALHLKWHDRMSDSTRSLAIWQGVRRNRSRVKATRMDFGQPGGLNLSTIHSYAQGGGQEGVNPGLSFSSRPILQGPNLVPVKTEQYAESLSFDYQPQECALFHDALQLNERVGSPLESDTYLAPLDGLSVLQPLPFEQLRGLPEPELS
ncbi:hypothetical protein EI94DRAFT_1798093 [Lactarius quietus]|nr:hypothetical protein EI94DRAFT_1798093 [Lactarius quietus]